MPCFDVGSELAKNVCTEANKRKHSVTPFQIKDVLFVIKRHAITSGVDLFTLYFKLTMTTYCITYEHYWLS